MIAGFETAEAGGNIANLFFSLCLIFCGVLANPDTMPRFWIFMYRVSPFTYIVSGLLSVAVANSEVRCASNEFLHFDPLNGTCAEFMRNYINGTTIPAWGEFQALGVTCARTRNRRGRTRQLQRPVEDFGLIFVYIIFNIIAALFVYWAVRVPKKKLGGKDAAAGAGAGAARASASNEKARCNEKRARWRA
ncbi:hypothetical protein MCOR02_007845 [Pyricularia oryzae]|nr:hypothetical protein MCOR02_007845 [Pyricularia oryzae]